MARVPKASGIPLVPNYNKPSSGLSRSSFASATANMGGAQLLSHPPLQSAVSRPSIDPFSTPARRRRIVGDIALFLVKQYYAKACKGVEEFRRYSKAAIIVQCAFRCMSSRRMLKHLRWMLQTRAVIVLQKHARRLAAQSLLIELRREAARLKRRNSAIKIQCRVRQMISINLVNRLRFIRRTKAAITIQRTFRGASGRRLYAAMRRAHKAFLLKINKNATVIQCTWRRYFAMRLLFRLKMKRRIIRSVICWWRNVILKRAVSCIAYDGQRFVRGMLARLRFRKMRQGWLEMLHAEERARQRECRLMLQHDIDAPSDVTVVELKAALPRSLLRLLRDGGPPSIAEWCITQGILALEEAENDALDSSVSFTTGALIQSIFCSVNESIICDKKAPGSFISLQHSRADTRAFKETSDEITAKLRHVSRLHDGWGKCIAFHAPGSVTRNAQLPLRATCNHGSISRLSSCIQCRPTLINELIRDNKSFLKNRLLFEEDREPGDKTTNAIMVKLVSFSLVIQDGTPVIAEKRVVLKFEADGSSNDDAGGDSLNGEISALKFQFNNSIIKVTMWDRAPAHAPNLASVAESFGTVEEAIEERMMPSQSRPTESGAHTSLDPGRVVHVLLIEEEEEDLIPYDEMATIIQCLVRICLAKARCQKMRILQSKQLFICAFLRRAFILHAWHSTVYIIIEKMHRSALNIQRTFRGIQGRRRFLKTARDKNKSMLDSLTRTLELCSTLPHPFEGLEFPISRNRVHECAAAFNLQISRGSMSLHDHPSMAADSSAHVEKFFDRIPSLGWASDLHSILGAPPVPPGCVNPDHLFVSTRGESYKADGRCENVESKDDKEDLVSLLKTTRNSHENQGSSDLKRWVLRAKNYVEPRWDNTFARRLAQGKLRNSKLTPPKFDPTSGKVTSTALRAGASSSGSGPVKDAGKLNTRPRSIPDSVSSEQRQLRKGPSMSSGVGKSSSHLKRVVKNRSTLQSAVGESADDAKKSQIEEPENASLPPVTDEVRPEFYPSFGDILIPAYSFTSSHREFGLKNLMKARRVVKPVPAEPGAVGKC